MPRCFRNGSKYLWLISMLEILGVPYSLMPWIAFYSNLLSSDNLELLTMSHFIFENFRFKLNLLVQMCFRQLSFWSKVNCAVVEKKFNDDLISWFLESNFYCVLENDANSNWNISLTVWHLASNFSNLITSLSSNLAIKNWINMLPLNINFYYLNSCIIEQLWNIGFTDNHRVFFMDNGANKRKLA